MYYGLIALLIRALRLDARQMRNHLFRLAFVVFIYFAMLGAIIESSNKGAPGLSFFATIAYLNAMFVTCAGIGFFSSAITEEKEEDTIGLLQMAGLNHLGILLGKSTSRLIQVMLLMVVQFPFMLLSVTLGGVTNVQIFAAYVDLLAYTILLANTALVCSVLFKRGGSAAGMTTLLLILHAISPWLANQELASLTSTGWTKGSWWQWMILSALEWIEHSCLFYELPAVMKTGFNEPVLTTQVISNIAGGLCAFGLAWLLFGPAVSNANPGAESRGLLLSPTSRVKFLSPGRCWNNSFIWKDFQFIGGGYSLLVGKFFGYVMLFGAMVIISLVEGNWLGFALDSITGIYIALMIGFLILEASISASRIFHDEIRLQTMSSLLMLPRSIPHICYSKAVGCVMGLIPAAFCLCLGLAMSPNLKRDDVFKLAFSPELWAVVMGILIFFHLVALLSLFIKWGALPAAFFIMVPLMTCCPIWQLVFFAIRLTPGQTDYSRWPATITVWILTSLVCFVFQMMIAARLQELGTK